MNIIRILVVRGLLLATLISSYFYVTYGKESTPAIPIVRNVAWNDLVKQINFSPADSPQDSLEKELRIIEKFLKTHETEVRVGIYDIDVFKALDQARSRLQKADKDLETLRNELSYKEEQARLGR
jgi:hypothetical protein